MTAPLAVRLRTPVLGGSGELVVRSVQRTARRRAMFTNRDGMQILFSFFTCMPNTQYTYLLLEYLVTKDVAA